MTPLSTVAEVSRIVTIAMDRVTGDRSGYPLLCCLLIQEALKHAEVESRILYGPAAWIEIGSRQQPYWAGCWGEHFSFWVETEFREIVELTAAVSYRRKPHQDQEIVPQWGPPLLWSKDVPSFYKFRPVGLAEVDPETLESERDRKWWADLSSEIREKIQAAKKEKSLHGEVEVAPAPHLFPSEPILVHRRLLDDAESSFAHYDRALGVAGIPEAPELS